MKRGSIIQTYAGNAPNFGPNGKQDYTGLPNLNERTVAQRKLAGRKGAAERCANQAKITMREPPWQKY